MLICRTHHIFRPANIPRQILEIKSQAAVRNASEASAGIRIPVGYLVDCHLEVFSSSQNQWILHSRLPTSAKS